MSKPMTKLNSICSLKRCGWIELKLMTSREMLRGYRLKYPGAAALCTGQGERVSSYWEAEVLD
jgi:hypothetical protein